MTTTATNRHERSTSSGASNVRRLVYLALTVLLLISIADVAAAQAPLKPGFDVMNSSSMAIKHVLAKPDGSPNWGSPLQNSAVAVGKSGSSKVPSETNCLYDVRLVFEDGRTEEHDKVDVCKHVRIDTKAESARATT